MDQHTQESGKTITRQGNTASSLLISPSAKRAHLDYSRMRKFANSRERSKRGELSQKSSVRNTNAVAFISTGVGVNINIRDGGIIGHAIKTKEIDRKANQDLKFHLGTDSLNLRHQAQSYQPKPQALPSSTHQDTRGIYIKGQHHFPESVNESMANSECPEYGFLKVPKIMAEGT